MFSVMYKFHLQDKIAISHNQTKCVDYVKITDLSNPSINEKFCGMQTLHHTLSTEILHRRCVGHLLNKQVQ